MSFVVSLPECSTMMLAMPTLCDRAHFSDKSEQRHITSSTEETHAILEEFDVWRGSPRAFSERFSGRAHCVLRAQVVECIGVSREEVAMRGVFVHA